MDKTTTIVKLKQIVETDSKLLHKNYVFDKKLENGSSSKIFLGRSLVDDKRVVIKRISILEEWKNELEILKMFKDSKKIINFKDFIRGVRFIYIITDYYKDCDLFEHAILNVPYTENYTKKLILEMAKCVKDCHDKNIVHRDIKLENFLVVDIYKPKILLIDFGHAEKNSTIELEKGRDRYGTSFFLCPEGYKYKYSKKSDIWSIGICTHFLLSDSFPFDDEDDEDEYDKNVLRHRLVINRNISPEASNFIKKCLAFNPSDRYSIEMLMSDPFLINT